MAELSLYDLEFWKFKGAVLDDDLQTNALATATLAAPGAGFRNRVVKVDASYETSSTSGLLTVKSGSTTIARKYIHGAGAIDFSDFGFAALAGDEAISAELAASGTAGVDGIVSISGFKTPDKS